MAITLTENAAKQIQQQILKRGKGIGLRVGIKKSGCSGFAYTFDYADEVGANEQLFKSFDTNVVIDIKNLPYLDGSQIDFVKEGLNSAFKFSNPNVDNTCGCGTSYSFKEA
jgi:iron-sulfur cluster assembly protein